MTLNQNPEQKARDNIDKLLLQAGWVVQNKNRINLDQGIGQAVREYQTDVGPADYVLFVGKKAVGVIEAKAEKFGHNITTVEEQTHGYAAAKLKWINNKDPLPFLYESTGVITRFTDGRDPKPRSREVFTFHRPETLKEWLAQGSSLRSRLQTIPHLDPKGLRNCQESAINNLEVSFKDNRPRALIQMATGSGKTYAAITAMYRLLKYGDAKRILFLVDTRNLGEQAEQEMMSYLPNDDNRKFTELYTVQRLQSSYVAKDSQVCISTIQRMYSILKGEEIDSSLEDINPAEQLTKPKTPMPVVYNPKVPIEFFDFIFIDECHRSIYNIWQQVLDYFDTKVVTWDSPIPSAEGEDLFIAQVDFNETGTVMADMALSILGADGGQFAVLSASPDAANQNAWIASMKEALKDPKYSKLELLDVVYGNDQSETSYNQALALVDKYPDMKLIMAPTTVGIAAAAKAMQDEQLCDKVKVSGLGLPAEMVSYTKNGCAPEFALWSFVDLGYLTYYASYLLASGALKGEAGEKFEAGRMGEYTIEKDPTRDNGLRVKMGPFTVYNKDNVDKEAGPQPAAGAGEVVKATPGQDVPMTLLPKFLGILVFDQANQGAQEAAAELKNPAKLEFLGPTPENSVAGQIEIVTNAATQGQKAVMLSNNAGDQIVPAVKAAKDAGAKVVTWDSPIPSAEGEDLFVAQVDFNETGTVMADMALSILGADGGKFAVLSASPDAANQNAWIASMKEALKDPKYSTLELLDVVYGNDQSETSYNQALALVDKYPEMELIMAPTTVGIAAAAKAMQDEQLCDKVKVSGLGLPAEMVSYTKNGCAPEFALWSFVDLGYLTYYATYLLSTGALKGEAGEKFEAGRMGEYTIEKDPTRDNGLRVKMGPFTIYNKDNVDKEAGPQPPAT